jgi:outer membrane protein assembly factor BamB
LLVVPGVAIVLVLAMTGGFLLMTGGAKGWTDTSLHVVGSPVAADGTVAVLDVSPSRELQLSAVNPTSGEVIWNRPFSASEVTPGVAFGPTVLGDTVLELAPEAGSADPSVTVEGLNVATGKVMWSVPQPLVLSDAPATCGGEFCVAVFDSETTSALLMLDPATGSVVATAQGPNRNMSVAPPGSANSGGLWETNDATATLVQISTFGQVLWSETVANLFGGTQYDPNYGWDFLTRGSLDIGSIGPAPEGHTYPLDQYKTLGITVSDGKVAWSDPGDYMCGGGLQFLSVDVICKYSGTVSEVGNSVSMSGVGLTLEGVNPTSGTVKWSLPVQGAQALSEGTGVAFVDGTHLVVEELSGQRALLDVATGALTPIAADQTFWCEQNPMYSVMTAQGASAGGKRQSSPVFNACSASGRPIQGVPSTTPSTVDVFANGMFVWPTSQGLRAAPLPA